MGGDQIAKNNAFRTNYSISAYIIILLTLFTCYHLCRILDVLVIQIVMSKSVVSIFITWGKYKISIIFSKNNEGLLMNLKGKNTFFVCIYEERSKHSDNLFFLTPFPLRR